MWRSGISFAVLIHFSVILVVSNIFHGLIWCLYIFFREISVQVFDFFSIFNWVPWAFNWRTIFRSPDLSVCYTHCIDLLLNLSRQGTYMCSSTHMHTYVPIWTHLQLIVPVSICVYENHEFIKASVIPITCPGFTLGLFSLFLSFTLCVFHFTTQSWEAWIPSPLICLLICSLLVCNQPPRHSPCPLSSTGYPSIPGAVTYTDTALCQWAP